MADSKPSYLSAGFVKKPEVAPKSRASWSFIVIMGAVFASPVCGTIIWAVERYMPKQVTQEPAKDLEIPAEPAPAITVKEPEPEIALPPDEVFSGDEAIAGSKNIVAILFGPTKWEPDGRVTVDVEPRNASGEFTIPEGTLSFAMTDPSGGSRLGRWDFPVEQIADKVADGTLHFSLQFPGKLPTATNAKLFARVTNADGSKMMVDTPISVAVPEPEKIVEAMPEPEPEVAVEPEPPKVDLAEVIRQLVESKVLRAKVWHGFEYLTDYLADLQERAIADKPVAPNPTAEKEIAEIAANAPPVETPTAPVFPTTFKPKQGDTEIIQKPAPPEDPEIFSPTQAVFLAARDLSSTPVEYRPFVRYISHYHVPTDRLQTEQRLLSFAANSVSTARLVTKPNYVAGSKGRLAKVDIRWYGWEAKAWEKLGENQAYFQDTWVDHPSVSYLKQVTGSNFPVVRSDDFTYRVTLEDQPTTPLVDGFYVDFLQVGKNQDEFLARFGVDRDAVLKARSNEGGSVVKSGVTNHNRRLERFPTTYSRNGYHWISYDQLSNTKDENVVRRLFDDLKPTATEQIGKLRNGGQYYGVFDLKTGNRLAQADINVAHDRNFEDSIVWSARSCIGCHASGINPFTNVMRELAESGKFDVRFADYALKQQAAEFYLTDLERAIEVDQQTYETFCKQATDLPPGVVAKSYVQGWKIAREQHVNLAMAARDMGVTVDQCDKLFSLSGEPMLLMIRAGESAPRDAWEEVFPQAMNLRTVIANLPNKAPENVMEDMQNGWRQKAH